MCEVVKRREATCSHIYRLYLDKLLTANCKDTEVVLDKINVLVDGEYREEHKMEGYYIWASGFYYE